MLARSRPSVPNEEDSMKRALPRLTYANVVSTLCLFILLGGGALAASGLAKNSIGPRQLRREAVRTAKIANEAVTTAKIKRGSIDGSRLALQTLGTVPSAQSAANANHAIRADSAAHADSASQAGDAQSLGGAAPSAYLGRVAQAASGISLHISGSTVSEATPGGPLAISVPAGVGFVVADAAASFADAASANTNVELWLALDEPCAMQGPGWESHSYGTLISTTAREELSQHLAFPVSPGPHTARLCLLSGNVAEAFSRTLSLTTVAEGPNG
jgi:hypothetical protein